MLIVACGNASYQSPVRRHLYRTGKEKGRANPAFLESSERLRSPLLTSGSLDVAGLLALRALRDFEGDLLAFLQRLESRHVDRGEMREEIFATAVRSNKAETLRVIEPLHGTCCHF